MRDEHYQSWQGQDNLFAAAIPLVLLVGVNNSFAATILIFVVGGFWLKNRDKRYSDWVKWRIEQRKEYPTNDDTKLSARMIADHLGMKFDEIDKDREEAGTSNGAACDENYYSKQSWDDLEQRRLELKDKLGRIRKPQV